MVHSAAQIGRFPAIDVAPKLAVSLGIGLLVGIEGEWSNKDLGARTFALTALLSAVSPPHSVCLGLEF
jgi:uncharacterized membrane protein YhiD involved in acid resistance